MYRKVLVTLCLIFCVAIPSHAALITVERATAYFTSLDVDLENYWSRISTSDIKSEPIEMATLIYSGSVYNHTIFKMTIAIPKNLNAIFSIYAGLDAGNGAEVFVNRTQKTNVSGNLWWNYDWLDQDIVAVEDLNFLSNSANLIEIYWAENGNSGGNSFEFSVGSDERFVLSNDNIQANLTQPSVAAFSTVPAPSTLALFGLALLRLRVKRCR
jgi:hypothetical protein